MKRNLKIKLSILEGIKQKGFFYLLSANTLIQIVSFASQLFVAGILLPEDLGRIKIILTFMSVFSIIAGLGFGASTLKLCAEQRSESDKKSIVQSALFFTVLSTMSLYLLLLIVNYFGYFSNDALIQWLMPLGLFPLVTNSIFIVFVSYFQAIKKIKLISLLTISNKVISILVIILLSYWWGIKGYYIAYNISFILILVVCFKSFDNEDNSRLFSMKHFTQFGLHWRYAKSSMLANLLSVIAAYADIIIINFFVSDMQGIGFYSFALTLTVTLSILPTTVQQIAIPYFSALTHQKEQFVLAFKRYNKILFWAVLLTLLAALLFGPIMVNKVFIGKYDSSMPFFVILAFGWSLRQLTQLQSGALFSLGRFDFSVYISIISMTFNIIIYALAIHFYGLMGAAYASIPCGIVMLSTSIYYFKRARNEMMNYSESPKI